MKQLIIILISVLFATNSFSKSCSIENLNVSFRKLKPTIANDNKICHAPYRGDAVTSSYDELGRVLTLWFHYGADNAEVKISKDGETIASETFDMSANDRLECDFSMCESGEYVICTFVGNVMQFVTSVYFY